LGKEEGAHNTGVEKVGREEQEADEKQHGPDPQVAQEEGSAVYKGIDEYEKTPVKYLCFVSAPAEPVIIVFHGLRIMIQSYSYHGKREKISTK
jgi:hypothetical protein